MLSYERFVNFLAVCSDFCNWLLLMACKYPTSAECLQFMRQEKNHNSAGLEYR